MSEAGDCVLRVAWRGTVNAHAGSPYDIWASALPIKAKSKIRIS